MAATWRRDRNASNEKDLASLFLTLKGGRKKRADWISIAKQCERVRKRNNSTSEAARELGIAYETLRSILSILELPAEVQRRVKNGEILCDAAQRISRIKDPARQKEVAKTIAGLKSRDQREIIQHAKKFLAADLSNFKKRVTAPRNVKNVHVVVIHLGEDAFNAVSKAGKGSGRGVEGVLADIVEQWAGASDAGHSRAGRGFCRFGGRQPGHDSRL